MINGERERKSRGFEASTKGKKTDVFGQIGVGKQVNSNRNIVKLSELLILLILSGWMKSPIPNFYTTLP